MTTKLLAAAEKRLARAYLSQARNRAQHRQPAVNEDVRRAERYLESLGGDPAKVVGDMINEERRRERQHPRRH